VHAAGQNTPYDIPAHVATHPGQAIKRQRLIVLVLYGNLISNISSV
jgi:hypothetical protein